MPVIRTPPDGGQSPPTRAEGLNGHTNNPVGAGGQRRHDVLRIVLFSVSGLFLVASAPCAFLGAMGWLGVLADAGAAENRQWGVQFLYYAAVPFGLGVITLVAALLRRGRKRTPK